MVLSYGKGSPSPGGKMWSGESGWWCLSSARAGVAAEYLGSGKCVKM